MALFAVKALLAPSFVVVASLVARHYGPWMGGVIGGLPVVAGPILLIYGISHGAAFAAGAALGTLLGLISLTAFAVVYGRLARRLPWLPCMLAGWLAFGVGTVVLDGISLPVGVALVLVWLGFALGLRLLPHPAASTPAPVSPPAWDLPLRAGCALLLVLVLTTTAGLLGPKLSGLLAPFPVITKVLATFTHAQRGAAEAARLLRGMLTGFYGFALFCFVLAISLRATGVALGFGIATACALLSQATIIRLAQRGRLSRAVSEGAPPAAAAAQAAPGHGRVGLAEISAS